MLLLCAPPPPPACIQWVLRGGLQGGPWLCEVQRPRPGLTRVQWAEGAGGGAGAGGPQGSAPHRPHETQQTPGHSVCTTRSHFLAGQVHLQAPGQVHLQG